MTCSIVAVELYYPLLCGCPLILIYYAAQLCVSPRITNFEDDKYFFKKRFTNMHSRNFSHKPVFSFCTCSEPVHPLGTNQILNILLNTISGLPQMCSLSHSCYLRCSTAFDLVSTSFTLNVSKQSKYTHFLITRLTGSIPNSCLSFSLFFFFQANNYYYYICLTDFFPGHPG